MTDKPVFNHDCDKCVYLGTWDVGDQVNDWYFCDGEYPVYVHRFGDGDGHWGGQLKRFAESESARWLYGMAVEAWRNAQPHVLSQAARDRTFSADEIGIAAHIEFKEAIAEAREAGRWEGYQRCYDAATRPYFDCPNKYLPSNPYRKPEDKCD